MIRLENVCKLYNQGQHNEVRAIWELSLQLAPNQITVFRGPSGSGKSTLLALIGCLTRPTRGRIWLEGELLSNLPERFMTQVRRETFGFIFQRFNLIRRMTVLENLLVPAYPLAPSYPRLRARAMELLHQFRLADRAHNKAEWLSGGEAQRTAICRALMNDPEILIADEPTANLDRKLSQEFMGYLEGLQAEGKTVLISSHDPLVFERPGIARIVALCDGRLCLKEEQRVR